MDSDRWRDEQRRLRAAAREARSPAAAAATEGQPEQAPLVSVIVACRDEEDVIARCLERLLEQAYEPYEVIVVDDGSRDRTREIAQRVLGSVAGEIIASPNTRGVAHARNLGLARARGDIVAFIDADGYAERDWLRELTAVFAQDERIGGVASTVFYAANPLVLNGAGGTINRLGRAADLAMNESYEHAKLTHEAVYAMGCGMAFRRTAIERIGPFDEAIVNYYDDVDYGIRAWRAGYRVAVASGAWIEHDLDPSGGVSTRRRRLSERHRVRVLLKHTPASGVLPWLRHEFAAVKRPGGRAARLDAIAWNLAHVAGLIAARRRLRGALRPPALIDPSWAEAFPTGLPPGWVPRSEAAGASFDAADTHSQEQLVHGWFAAETISGRRYVWAAAHAALLIRLERPAKQLTVRYAHVPVESEGVEARVRRLGSETAPEIVWRSHFGWQYIEHSLENHPVELPAGDYEVLFDTRDPWTDPPRETRSLAFALAYLSFAPSYELAPGGIDMAAPRSEHNLLYGWFEAEKEGERVYRWAGKRAALAVRSEEPIRAIKLRWRPRPGGGSELQLELRALSSAELLWSARAAESHSDWCEANFETTLDAGSYVIALSTDATWSNAGASDPSSPAERRALGFALASLELG